MKNYWKNTKYTSQVRIKSEHLFWLKKQKGNRRSVANLLEEILDAKILESYQKQENKISTLRKYGTNKK